MARPGGSRRGVALGAMRVFGFNDDLIETLLNDLLEEYSWEVIEQDNYQVLLDAILARQQPEINSPSGLDDLISNIAMPEIPVDVYSDMRLDIDEMSYEELLALGEQIGDGPTGLSVHMIRSRLKTRMLPSPTFIDNESCPICSDGYQSLELDCGHEFHVRCLRKWLGMKNLCPICKSQALSSE